MYFIHCTVYRDLVLLPLHLDLRSLIILNCWYQRLSKSLQIYAKSIIKLYTLEQAGIRVFFFPQFCDVVNHTGWYHPQEELAKSAKLKRIQLHFGNNLHYLNMEKFPPQKLMEPFSHKNPLLPCCTGFLFFLGCWAKFYPQKAKTTSSETSTYT